MQIDEAQVVNCDDLAWMAQIPNVLNDRLGQHNQPAEKDISLQ
jgi:hypothetical protein